MQRHRVPFVLAASLHGPMILHSLDWKSLGGTAIELGPGADIMINGHYDLDTISLCGGMLLSRRQSHGDGVVALDCGANIGAYTLEWARLMEGWGEVIAFEPQEHIYYALAGNVALNNLFNARLRNVAIGGRNHVIDMPKPDYATAGNFGGLTLKRPPAIGQDITATVPIQVREIDAMDLPRVDFIKLDIEGMEMEALNGARATIASNRPYMLVEWHVAGRELIEAFMASVDYETWHAGMNLICGPKGNDVFPRLRALREHGVQ